MIFRIRERSISTLFAEDKPLGWVALNSKVNAVLHRKTYSRADFLGGCRFDKHNLCFKQRLDICFSCAYSMKIEPTALFSVPVAHCPRERGRLQL